MFDIQRFTAASDAADAVRLLRARGVDVKIGGSVTKSNLADLDRILAIGRELDVPVVDFNAFSRACRGGGSGDLPDVVSRVG